MFRKIRALWALLSGVGPVVPLSRQLDQLFRYHVLETLADEKLFNFLEEPKEYGQVLKHFGYVDSDFTRDLFNILTKDKRPVLLEQNGKLVRNTQVPIPELEDVVKKTTPTVHSFGLVAKGMTRYIPARLRNEPVEFSDSFEQDGRQLMTKFDKNLANRGYTAIRNTAYAYLRRPDRMTLEGAKLLEVGCGSGRETAELWLKSQGNIKITAIDPVASLVELAKLHFEDYLDEMEPSHARLTKDNAVKFMTMDATKMTFGDNTFDAAFHNAVLHWTPDPRKAIAEIVRVLKPGGLVFGTQQTKPLMNPYFDIVIRSNERTYGFFWQEEFTRWYAENGVRLEMATPVGAFCGRKPLAP